jgi:hypothetical protein
MNIYQDGILISVNVCYWSGAKKLLNEDMGLSKDKVVDAFKLGRKMLIPEKTIQAFKTVESRARYAVDSCSFKFPIGSANFVPKKRFAKVIEALKECKLEYNRLIDDLVAHYDEYKQSMLPVYREAAEIAYVAQAPAEIVVFNIEDREREKETFIQQFINRIQAYYPTTESLRERFSLDWTVYEVALPRMRVADVDKLSKDIATSEIANEEFRIQAQEKIGKFVNDVVQTLRAETTELCNHIIANITDGKVVKGRTLTSLKDFIDKFQELNFVGDVKIEKQLEVLRKEYLSVHTTEQISEQPELQEELKRRLGQLAEIAADMTDINSVTGEYKRKIEW